LQRIIIYDIYTSFIEYIGSAVGYSVLVILIGYILKMLLIPKRINVQTKFRPRRVVLFFVCNIYIFLLISITILSREPGSRTEVNLLVFDTFSKNSADNVYPIENILLFIPFGLLLPLLIKQFRNVIRISGFGIMSSLVIEVIQYITQRGYFQTDDIIANVLGTLIGYIIFIIVNRCYKSKP
jgi:glycopeptide antibiotics resistance protein